MNPFLFDINCFIRIHIMKFLGIYFQNFTNFEAYSWTKIGLYPKSLPNDIYIVLNNGFPENKMLKVMTALQVSYFYKQN